MINKGLFFILYLSVLHNLPAQHHGLNSPNWNFEEARQFDFWIGTWDVNLRMIQDDLTWKDQVNAEAKIYSILDGKAVLELWDSPFIKGYSLRHYDVDKKKWVLYLNWPSKNASGSSSLEGSFRHGRGEFFASRKNPKGQDVLSRYTFSDISPTKFRWDDAFSIDDGKTWTNNWIMEFTRSSDSAQWPELNEQVHTYESGERCDREEFRTFEKLTGQWKGKISTIDENGSNELVEATLEGWKVLDGCAVMNLLTYNDENDVFQSFSMKTFNTYANIYEDTRIDNQVGSNAQILYGSNNDNQINLVESDPGQVKEEVAKYSWNLLSDNSIEWTKWISKDQKATWQKAMTGTFSKQY